jgi:hypothetical protein
MIPMARDRFDLLVRPRFRATVTEYGHIRRDALDRAADGEAAENAA